MRTALAYEWWRMRTLRSTWWMVSATLIVTALLALAFGSFIRDMSAEEGQPVPPCELLIIMLTKSPLTPVIAGTLGVQAMGHEYRHGTIRTILTLTPRRSVVFGAKVASTVAFSLLLALANLAVAWTVALVMRNGDSLTGVSFTVLLRVHIGQIVLIAGWGLAGVALGSLIRSQTVGLLTMLAIPFMVEPMLRAVFSNSGQPLLEHAAKFLPFTAGSALTSVADASTTLMDSSAQLHPLAAGVAFLSSVMVMTAAAATAFYQRDA